MGQCIGATLVMWCGKWASILELPWCGGVMGQYTGATLVCGGVMGQYTGATLVV